MSLSVRGVGARLMCLSVRACAEEDSQGHYSLIRPLWSTRVISPAWGVPRTTSTISHLPLTIYPSDNHPNPASVAEAAWDWAEARQPPQHCERWVLMKSVDISQTRSLNTVEYSNYKLRNDACHRSCVVGYNTFIDAQFVCLNMWIVKNQLYWLISTFRCQIIEQRLHWATFAPSVFIMWSAHQLWSHTAQ